MATLVAIAYPDQDTAPIAYPDQDTAQQARATLWRLEEELIIQAEEVAVISRDPDGKYHVHTGLTGPLS